ncbi:PepSY domain-containing protein [Anaerococcus senegalensis]|uniref:PepSY domain-containing protein n=1 Tax=Anaerococcus senegalensis TaxID=1288120 RepID=UPI000319E1A4|nr:PepSY domain-containing protein [Anaerococcus senegalensis]
MKLKKNLKYGASALALALLLSACSGENAKQAKEDAKDAASNAKAAVSEEVASTKEKAEDKKEEIKSDVSNKKDEAEEKVDQATTGIEEKEFAISLDDAVNKFKEAFKVDGIEVSSVEFDKDNDKYSYDISGFKGNEEFEAKIDAESGEVISKEQDKDDDQEDKAIDFTKVKAPKEAIAKALENNKGFVKSYELDVNDQGKTVYEIDVVGGDDVELDAETLDIIQK